MFNARIAAINASRRAFAQTPFLPPRLRDSVLLLTSYRREMFIGIIEKPMAIFLAPFAGRHAGSK